MSTIFIPTDFQKDFLELIPVLTNALDDTHSDIILGHLFKVKGYEQLYWKKNIEFKNIDLDFIIECESRFLLKKSLSVRNFVGSSVAGLKLFFEINHIDLILNPVDYSFKKISKYSIQNPCTIIKRSGFPVSEVHSIGELIHATT